MDIWVGQHVQFMNVKSTNLDIIVENNFLEFRYSLEGSEHPEIVCKILYEEEEAFIFAQETVDNFP